MVVPNVTLQSAPGSRARLNGRIWIKNTADGVAFKDVDVDGTTGSNAWAILVHADNVTLYGLDVTNRKAQNGTYAICILAGQGFEQAPANIAWYLTVDHVRSHHCGDDNHEHGLYLESTRYARIVDSAFWGSPGAGVQMYPDAQNTLVEYSVLDGNSLASKTNLIFAGEQAGGEYANSYASSNNIVERSIITNAVTRYNVDAYYPASNPLPAGNEVRFSCVAFAPFGNFGHDRAGDYTEHDNILDQDPLYRDRANGDFTLLPGSPCAGYGPR